MLGGGVRQISGNLEFWVFVWVFLDFGDIWWFSLFLLVQILNWKFVDLWIGACYGLVGLLYFGSVLWDLGWYRTVSGVLAFSLVFV